MSNIWWCGVCKSDWCAEVRGISENVNDCFNLLMKSFVGILIATLGFTLQKPYPNILCMRVRVWIDASIIHRNCQVTLFAHCNTRIHCNIALSRSKWSYLNLLCNKSNSDSDLNLILMWDSEIRSLALCVWNSFK